MENKQSNEIKIKIKNLQNSIVQRAIIKDNYILNDAMNFLVIFSLDKSAFFTHCDMTSAFAQQPS